MSTTSEQRPLRYCTTAGDGARVAVCEVRAGEADDDRWYPYCAGCGDAFERAGEDVRWLNRGPVAGEAYMMDLDGSLASRSSPPSDRWAGQEFVAFAVPKGTLPGHRLGDVWTLTPPPREESDQ